MKALSPYVPTVLWSVLNVDFRTSSRKAACWAALQSRAPLPESLLLDGLSHSDDDGPLRKSLLIMHTKGDIAKCRLLSLWACNVMRGEEE